MYSLEYNFYLFFIIFIFFILEIFSRFESANCAETSGAEVLFLLFFFLKLLPENL